MRPRAGGCPQHKGCSCGCRSTRTTPPGRRCRCRRRSRWRTFALRCASGAGSGGWPASPKATRRRLEPPGSIRQRRPVRHGLLGGRGSLGRAGTPHGAHARPERGHPALPGPMVAADPRGGPAPGPPEPARPRGTGSGAGLRARAWEVHAKGYWNQVRNGDGTTYPTEEAYFRHVLGLASWRTAYRRLAIGRMLTRFEEPERSLLRSSLARVGLAKGTVVAPAIERFEEWRTWLQCASELSTMLLQAKVSEALDALPRGREPSPPGERFRRAVLSAMPDIEAMELVERFFELGKRVVSSPNPIAIFLAGCRECLPEWELQAAKPTRAASNVSNIASCPRGQNPA